MLLIAGGIGVTPIRAMFHVCMDLGIAVTVLYSVRCPEDAAFLKEFQEVSILSDASDMIQHIDLLSCSSRHHGRHSSIRVGALMSS